MAQYSLSNLRNICVIGHGGDGKTTLSDAMLFCAGASDRLGKIINGTSKFDYDPDEIKKKGSISATLGFCEWKKNKVNIIDTPGDANFIGDIKSSLRVADGAVLLVDAHSGVKVQTERTWNFCDELELPRIVFVNMMDKERANYEKTVEALKEVFKVSFVPLQYPIGSEQNFKGVVDLLDNKAHIYKNDESGKYDVVDVPQDIAADTASLKDRMVESLVEIDEATMEKYLEGTEISTDELRDLLKRGVTEGKVVPILCGSAEKNIGVHDLLDAVVNYTPSPDSKTTVKGKTKDGTEKEIKIGDDSPFNALVFKTIADPFAGKLSCFRVYSGKLESDSQFYNASKKIIEKVGQIFFLHGKEHVPAKIVKTGDIAAFAKLKETTTGNTICASEDNSVTFDFISFPSPMIAYAVLPKTKGDEEKVSTCLARLCEEDPTLRVNRNTETRETLLAGMGDSHVELAVERLKRKFNVEVELHKPTIPYRETIKAKIKTQGKYKRQSGGRGQYGDAWIEIEPLPRSKGFEFVDKIVGGAIPRNYIPSVEKGIVEAMVHGELAGFPVVDLRVTLYDGSYHEVDSSDMAFKIAASMGFKKAFMDARPILLEPVMDVEITVPEDCMGDIIGDVNARRGRMKGVDAKGKIQVIKAQVPMAEMLEYVPSLKSISGGRGFFTMGFSHYEEVPAHLSEKIIAEHKKEKEEKE
ncbi:MAG: elongation factor G [Candidatus Schekmanbacteria bacterium]|nr:elongation factor G [Candidatus Schekmanbacteria bacterium]